MPPLDNFDPSPFLWRVLISAVKLPLPNGTAHTSIEYHEPVRVFGKEWRDKQTTSAAAEEEHQRPTASSYTFLELLRAYKRLHTDNETHTHANVAETDQREPVLHSRSLRFNTLQPCPTAEGGVLSQRLE